MIRHEISVIVGNVNTMALAMARDHVIREAIKRCLIIIIKAACVVIDKRAGPVRWQNICLSLKFDCHVSVSLALLKIV